MARHRAEDFPWKNPEPEFCIFHGQTRCVLCGPKKPADSKPEELALWASSGPKPKKKKRASSMSDATFIGLVEEVNGMLAGGRWAEAKPEHFVALVADLHFRVYGVVDSTLTPAKRAQAKGLAKRLLEVEFGGDALQMSEFLRWLWSRERSKETYRREHGIDGRRLDWRQSFAKYHLVDWKLSKHRAKTAASVAPA